MSSIFQLVVFVGFLVKRFICMAKAGV